MAGLTEDDLTRDWSLAPDDAAEVLRARGTEHRLRCAVQLCTLRATGRFVADYRHVPIEVVNHLAAQLGLDPLRLQERAAEGMTPGPLLAHAEDLLRTARVILPATSTLERLVASVAAHAVQDLFDRIASGLSEHLRDAIEDMVDVPNGEHRSPLAHLKDPPSAARAPAIAARLAKFDLLDGLLGSEVDFAATTPQLLQHFAQLGRRYDAQALKRFPVSKRHALVAAFLVETRKALLDQAVTMHDQY